jgi:endonuclease/exonuclease/phosphatase family metal-dependent hydrolase
MLKTSMPQRRTRLLLGVLTLSALLAAAPAQASTPTAKVMTRNLYLGADLTPAIQATSFSQLLAADASIFTAVHQTDFPARAKVLAREIKNADPDLIGLQEAALWRQGQVGVLDGGPATPATEVVFDFLASLRSELAALGDPYSVVRVQQEADIEAPAGSPYNRDIRLTMRDVILAKASLPANELSVQSTNSANFSNNLTFNTVAGPVTSTRGWVSANVTVHKHTFRFVDTHLEAFSNFYRTAQSQELLAGPLNTSGPVVLVGDLNSDPNDPVFNESGSPFNNTNPYDQLTGAGFADAWVQANDGASGPTCCNAADLLNPSPTLTQRIDHVLTKANAGAATGDVVVGTDADNRTPSGLWPSDHAGVVATLNP